MKIVIVKMVVLKKLKLSTKQMKSLLITKLSCVSKYKFDEEFARTSVYMHAFVSSIELYKLS